MIESAEINRLAEKVADIVIARFREEGFIPCRDRYSRPLASEPSIQQQVERDLELWRQKQAKSDALDAEIRQESQNLPTELRPIPEQYKSVSRKEEVLELLKDPTQRDKIPKLSRQWPGVKRKKPEDNADKR